MSEPSERQAAFFKALTAPEAPAPPDVRRPLADGAPQTRRFDVYRNNVMVTAVDALADTFPAVRALTGDAFFHAAARDFFLRSPPRSPLLFRYGDGFPAFLEAHGPAMRTAPYLGDVARLELARVQAYHAADAAPLAIAALGALPAETVGEVRLAAHPSLALIRSRFPVVSLWAASVGSGASEDVDMARPEDALVIRPGLDVDARILPPGGGALLAALIDGFPLSDAAEAAAAEGEADLAAHLAGLFEAGCFTAIATTSCTNAATAP